MSIAKMQKIQLVGLLAQEDQILELLKKEGLIALAPSGAGLEIHPSKLKRAIDETENQETQIAQIRSAIGFIEKFVKTKKTLIDSIIPPKIDLKKDDLALICRDFKYNDLLNKIQELDQEINNIHSLKNNLQNNYNAILPFSKLNFPLRHLHEDNKVNIMLGSIGIKNHKKFEIDIRALSPHIETEIVDFTKNEAYLAIYYLSDQKEKIETFLSKSTFARIKLAYSKNTPAEEVKNIQNQIKNSNTSEKAFTKEAIDLNAFKKRLMLLHDLLLGKQQNYTAKNKSTATSFTFVIDGWLKAKDLARLKIALPNTAAVFEIEPEKGEKIPVAIETPKAFGPFQLIVNIFGTPNQRDIEPTIPLTPFFILFFGICLSDAGYGILLILLATLLLKKLKLPPGGKNLVMLLLLGGITAVPIGILTGSYLGLSAQELPNWLFILKELQIIEPLKSPFVILVMSLLLGITQILFGLLLDGIRKIKEKDFSGAIFDNLLWIFFLLSLVSLFVVQSPINKNGSIILAILLVLTQGRAEKNIFKKLLRGLLSLYKVSGYMGDTLSYSRLLALMMSTSIIGMVINILANMARESVPIIGYIFMFAILIIGHAFNLIISTMSAFVHSLRLQLVEFFSKFFIGGGIEFKPFRHETKYVNIIKD